MNTSSTTRCHNICSDLLALSLIDPGSKLLSIHRMINTTRQCNRTSFYFCHRFSLSGPISLLPFLLFAYMGRGDMTKRKLIGLFPTEEMRPDLLSWQTEEKPHLQPHGWFPCWRACPGPVLQLQSGKTKISASPWRAPWPGLSGRWYPFFSCLRLSDPCPSRKNIRAHDGRLQSIFMCTFNQTHANHTY